MTLNKYSMHTIFGIVVLGFGFLMTAQTSQADPANYVTRINQSRISDLIKPGDLIIDWDWCTACDKNYFSARKVLSVQMAPPEDAYMGKPKSLYAVIVEQDMFFTATGIVKVENKNQVLTDGKCLLPTKYSNKGCYGYVGMRPGDDPEEGHEFGTCVGNIEIVKTFIFKNGMWRNLASFVEDEYFNDEKEKRYSFSLNPQTFKKLESCLHDYEKPSTAFKRGALKRAH